MSFHTSESHFEYARGGGAKTKPTLNTWWCFIGLLSFHGAPQLTPAVNTHEQQHRWCLRQANVATVSSLPPSAWTAVLIFHSKLRRMCLKTMEAHTEEACLSTFVWRSGFFALVRMWCPLETEWRQKRNKNGRIPEKADKGYKHPDAEAIGPKATTAWRRRDSPKVSGPAEKGKMIMATSRQRQYNRAWFLEGNINNHVGCRVQRKSSQMTQFVLVDTCVL